MKRSKPHSKKQPKGGVDFKKIKRKIGRKLPPPKNATNVEIKSKAIILPEQSLAAEKAGVALSKKGLTLKELLQQTSHYSSKVRKDALQGIKDLLCKHPTELVLHKLVVVEKLRERIGDDDKVVRESLYQLLKSVIFPGCKEDNKGLLSSLLMAYVFNAMTHLSVDVRLMAFKFLELVIQYHPPSFSLFAEKVLCNYAEILQKNQFRLLDKGKFKSILGGLAHCLTLLASNKRETASSENNYAEEEALHAYELDVPAEATGNFICINKVNDLVPVLLNCFQESVAGLENTHSLDAQSFQCLMYILRSLDHAVRIFLYGMKVKSELQPFQERPDFVWEETISTRLFKKLLSIFPLNCVHHLSEKENDKYFIMNIAITELFLHSSQCVSPPDVLLERFLEFIENSLLEKNHSYGHFGKRLWEKHVISLLPFIPKLVSFVAGTWKFRLLQAFTSTFKDSHPDSPLKLACLSAIEKMLLPRYETYLDPGNPEVVTHQVAWIREFPSLLILLGSKNPACSQAVLRIQLHFGQYAPSNTFLSMEYDNLQFPLQGFFGLIQDEGNINYGPFLSLPEDSKELSICSLNYFSYLDPLLLKSLALCCLSPDLEPDVLLRIIEVLQSAYKAGRIQIADHLSFFVTLLSRFKVLNENSSIGECNGRISSNRLFKSITRIVCSYLSQMGDCSLLLEILEKIIIEQLLVIPPLHNSCALIRVLATLDSSPSVLSQHSVITLGNYLSSYMIDIVQSVPKVEHNVPVRNNFRACHFFLLPCFILFDQNRNLLKLVLEMMGAFVTESSLWRLSRNCLLFTTNTSSRIDAVAAVIVAMHENTEIWSVMASFKPEIDRILENVLSLQSSTQTSTTIQERHKVQCAIDKLKIVVCTIPQRLKLNSKGIYQ